MDILSHAKYDTDNSYHHQRYSHTHDYPPDSLPEVRPHQKETQDYQRTAQDHPYQHRQHIVLSYVILQPTVTHCE